MLAFTDGGIARLARAIQEISPRKRRRWLRNIARKLDPPTLSAADNVDPPSNEKLERQRALGRAKYHRWRALQPCDRAHAQGVIYDPLTLGNLVTNGWIKRNKNERYTPSEIGAAISELIRSPNLPFKK